MIEAGLRGEQYLFHSGLTQLAQRDRQFVVQIYYSGRVGTRQKSINQVTVIDRVRQSANFSETMSINVHQISGVIDEIY